MWSQKVVARCDEVGMVVEWLEVHETFNLGIIIFFFLLVFDKHGANSRRLAIVGCRLGGISFFVGSQTRIVVDCRFIAIYFLDWALPFTLWPIPCLWGLLRRRGEDVLMAQFWPRLFMFIDVVFMSWGTSQCVHMEPLPPL